MSTHPTKEHWATRRKEILGFLRKCAVNHYIHGTDSLPAPIIASLKVELKSSRPKELQAVLQQYRAEVDRLNPDHEG